MGGGKGHNKRVKISSAVSDDNKLIAAKNGALEKLLFMIENYDYVRIEYLSEIATSAINNNDLKKDQTTLIYSFLCEEIIKLDKYFALREFRFYLNDWHKYVVSNKISKQKISSYYLGESKQKISDDEASYILNQIFADYIEHKIKEGNDIIIPDYKRFQIIIKQSHSIGHHGAIKIIDKVTNEDIFGMNVEVSSFIGGDMLVDTHGFSIINIIHKLFDDIYGNVRRTELLFKTCKE